MQEWLYARTVLLTHEAVRNNQKNGTIQKGWSALKPPFRERNRELPVYFGKFSCPST